MDLPTAHMIVKNEDQWIWYVLQSVLPSVSRILIYDTGSTDLTLNIISYINNPKIEFRSFTSISPDKLTDLRNQQLERTTTSWFLLVDGDEIWPKKSLMRLTEQLDKSDNTCNGVVVPVIVPVGDLFHYQPEIAGKYNLMGRVGHYNLRAYKKVSGYSWKGTYPLEAYVDGLGIAIQEKPQNLIMLDKPYWHMTHLKRSSTLDHGKRKLEIGEKHSCVLPEVFFATRPVIVPTPWISFGALENFIAHILTPLLNIKRHLSLPRLQDPILRGGIEGKRERIPSLKIKRGLG